MSRMSIITALAAAALAGGDGLQVEREGASRSVGPSRKNIGLSPREQRWREKERERNRQALIAATSKD